MGGIGRLLGGGPGPVHSFPLSGEAKDRTLDGFRRKGGRRNRQNFKQRKRTNHEPTTPRTPSHVPLLCCVLLRRKKNMGGGAVFRAFRACVLPFPPVGPPPPTPTRQPSHPLTTLVHPLPLPTRTTGSPSPGCVTSAGRCPPLTAPIPPSARQDHIIFVSCIMMSVIVHQRRPFTGSC